MDLKNSKYQHCSKRIIRAMRTSSDDFYLIIVALWSLELLKYVPKKPSHSTNLTISIFTQRIYKKESATIVDNSVLEPFEKAATIFNKASWRCGRSIRRNMTMVKKKLSACDVREAGGCGLRIGLPPALVELWLLWFKGGKTSLGPAL